MRTIVAVIFLVGLCAYAGIQVTGSTNQAVLPAVGLEIGQQAPAFTLVDQFGQEHSNATLKGPKGTVLLFFRSADW